MSTADNDIVRRGYLNVVRNPKEGVVRNACVCVYRSVRIRVRMVYCETSFRFPILSSSAALPALSHRGGTGWFCARRQLPPARAGFSYIAAKIRYLVTLSQLAHHLPAIPLSSLLTCHPSSYTHSSTGTPGRATS